ncbi:hypothetical protein NOR51B_1124 [Luminiphilus syltensis NOR5-1B]|uniref:Uncharacterized protein n=1 Tax=Luminiphilus syltensis NOR5-1B TaxID=565045 RepID=B8KTF4_9GAMM|nr:hypothetical protein NOR51B_1124 [Luminiphilus syltensis NOR5-1B]
MGQPKGESRFNYISSEFQFDSSGIRISAAVDHTIGFVQHEGLEVFQLVCALLQMILGAAARADNDVIVT